MNREAMSPAEVAAMFGVNSKTLVRWANAGRLSSFRTPGGHRRYYRSEVERLLAPTAQAEAAEAGRALAETARAGKAKPTHPYVIPERSDLEGRTFTVERLPEDVNFGPAEHFGKLAVISRLDGRFDEVALVAGDGDTAERLQTIADALAVTCGLDRTGAGR